MKFDIGLERDIKKLEQQGISIYDSVRRPYGTGFLNQLNSMHNGQLIADRQTGLQWMNIVYGIVNYYEALDLLDKVNDEKKFGFRNWRLPTADECYSIMKPKQYNGFHLEDVFVHKDKTVWTVDNKSSYFGVLEEKRLFKDLNWTVDFADGTIKDMWHDCDRTRQAINDNQNHYSLFVRTIENFRGEQWN